MLQLLQICKGHEMHNSTVTIHCDGLSAIKSIEIAPSDSFSTKKNFDLINSILSIQHILPIYVLLAHIKGHQDMGSAYQTLPQLAQLNVLADNLAKTKAQDIITSNINPSLNDLPYSHCDVFIKTQIDGNKKISTDLISTLRSLITRDLIRNYWIDKKELSNVYHQVDWKLRHKSTANQNRGQQQWLCKHVSGFCGVGSMLVKYKYQTHSNCPRCG